MANRIRSIDLVRGAIMVLMAIDHVRVYSGVPAGGPAPAIFFTRWVTHFCAPGFFFLAGTSAFLLRERLGRAALARRLVTRGALLVALELVLMRFAWTFNLDYPHYLLAGVLWALGFCMVLLAALIFLPLPAIAAVGLAICALHNLAFVGSLGNSLTAGNFGWLWQIVYFGSFQQLGPLVILYVLIPWIGVMALGYAFGAVLRSPQARTRSLAIGAACIAAFVILRALDGYGDPRPWHAPGPIAPALRFLNTAKYPASLDFLLMTLGPIILALPLVEGLRGRVARVLEVFGRVPLFYYLLHIPLIHCAALIVSLIRGGHLEPWLLANHPMRAPQAPPGYQWSLPLLYLVTALCVAALYWPCKWYAQRGTSPGRASSPASA